MNLQHAIGLGVAGNFTGHLEQAGEAKDFLLVEVLEKDAPKGIFPFYVPFASTYHGVFPLSSTTIAMPEGAVLQPEPEVALICEVLYENNQVSALIPKEFGAYNDCSIRADAPKISKKKNWGEHSKGLSEQRISIDQFAPGGIIDTYNLVCFLKRDGEVFEYGEDSEIKTYSYFYDKLLAWLVEKMNTQQDSGPLEHISQHLQNANFPTQAIISIGATRYTAFGEKTYLEKGDEVFVIVYDRNIYTNSSLVSAIKINQELTENISVLHQTVV